MMKKRFICVFCLVNLFAHSEIFAQKTATKTVTPKPVVKSTIAPPVFKPENKEDTTEGRFFCLLKVEWNQKIIDLGEVGGHFNPLTKEEKSRFKIPKTSVASGKAFWGGLETVYYIVSTPKGWAILRKYEDESTDGKQPYETVKILTVSK
jgi:hypothetical protein